MPVRGRLPTLLSVAIVVLAGLAACAAAGWRWGHARDLDRQAALARQQLQLHAQSLEQLVGRYRALPQLLALDPELRAALAAPVDAERTRHLNARLEQANRTARASTLTLISGDGVAVAASNWREPGSNVGESYGFRPYVQQAIRHGQGRFYGVGVTTGQPGYFLSEAIRGDDGALLGVVVIKIGLGALEQDWLGGTDTVLVSDRNGVVFLASDPRWRYRTLRPLDAATVRALATTRQYPAELLQPARLQPLQTLDPQARVLRLRQPPQSGRWLMVDSPLSEPGWTLHLLHDAGDAELAARQAAAVAALLWTALVLATLFVQQRRRMGALRRRSRQELETLVKQHARELRTARDGLVEAAQQADTGLSQQLAHLPQGVVIIDAALRIVAWNARYLELFRFPPDLVRVGRPIEDVFRHNARRGLLGPGPVEAAIQRRLDHLRSGRPHMHEREKDDGMVLEIRGNPLPDGGFVTSYTDITSYKQAARDLRSLADALEARVAERTLDLEQARHDAVDANRNKTRFVAAAVHDLLQPLNAARMFLSALQTRLPDADARGIAAHAEDALAAQDAILTSLLDIARLESGTQPTEVRDFALGPLLDALAREFRLLAEAKGLALDLVATAAVVRSDEALLRRIVQNLLSNAVRYTARGRIVLGCRRDGDGLRIEVHDTGPGIAPERQREIFEEFRRLDDAAEHGAGLGLAIVDRIARLLGHAISLRSAPGRGSVFAVRVPRGDATAIRVEAAPAAAAETADASLLHGCRVWCIDDDPRINEASSALLQRWGCTVAFAGGPAAALARARPGDAPELVLLDLRMGELTGPDTYDRLAAIWRAAPGVVLATAERDADVRALAQQRGWAYLPKPVRPAALRAVMTQLRLRGPRAD